jgi:hypothetical protein
MNALYILGNPIWEKTQLEGEAYALLSFLQIWKCIYKERGTHCGVSFDTVACVEDTKSFPPLLCSQNTTPRCFAQLWNKNNVENGTSPPRNGWIFNIAQYPYRVRVLTSSTLN